MSRRRTLPFRPCFLQQLSQSSGEPGVGARRDAIGSRCCAHKPSQSRAPLALLLPMPEQSGRSPDDNERTGGSRGPSVSPAMLCRLSLLSSRSLSLESRTLLLSRLASNRLDARWANLLAEPLEKSSRPEYDGSSITFHLSANKREESVREDADPGN